MKKLIGHKRKKTCIFISGTGTNLKSLIEFSKKKISPISINLVISNKKAKGLGFAKKYKIENKIINFSNSKKAETTILNLSKTIKVDKLKKIPYFLPSIFLFVVLIQISFGALVSGLDAGQIYNTWPLMNQNFFPDDAKFITLLSTEMFETPSILQFIHRNIAYGIFLFFLLIFFIARKLDSYNYLKNAINLVFLSLLLQIFLGILAVLYNAHIFIASLHQIGSIILIASVIILIFKNSKIS